MKNVCVITGGGSGIGLVAGMSPAMAKPEQLMRVNALGTVYVNQELRNGYLAGVDILCDGGSVVGKKMFRK